MIESEQGSFVDPKDLENQTKPEKGKDLQEDLFSILNKIVSVLTQREDGTVHQLCRIADATEALCRANGINLNNPSTPVSPRLDIGVKPLDKPVTTPTPPTQPATPAVTKTDYIGRAKVVLKEFIEDLTFEETNDTIIVRTRRKIDNFRGLMDCIKTVDGRYISDKANTRSIILKANLQPKSDG